MVVHTAAVITMLTSTAGSASAELLQQPLLHRRQQHDDEHDGHAFGEVREQPLMPEHDFGEVDVAHENTQVNVVAEQHLSPMPREREHDEVDAEVAPERPCAHALLEWSVEAVPHVRGRRAVERLVENVSRRDRNGQVENHRSRTQVLDSKNGYRCRRSQTASHHVERTKQESIGNR